MSLPVLILVPVGLGVLTLVVFGWRRAMGIRRSKKIATAETRQKTALGPSGLRLRPEGLVQRLAEGSGQISLMFVGSYGSALMPYVLRAFKQIGAAGHVGPVLLVEFDDDHRSRSLNAVPSEFLDRIVIAESPNDPIGMAGKPIAAVWARRGEWLPRLREATSRWLNLTQRSKPPGILAVFLSPGGSAALGRPPVDAFRDRYPNKDCYVFTILDQKTPVRLRFAEWRYFFGNRFKAWFITDNRRSVEAVLLSDVAVSLFLASMVGASWIGAMPLDFWNLAEYMFPGQDGGVATLSVVTEPISVRYDPGFEDAVEPRWYTDGALIEEKGARLTKVVHERPDLMGIPREPASKGSTRLSCVIVPLRAEDLEACRKRIDESLEEWRASDPDLSIQYASMGVPLGPETTETHMVVVEVQPLADGLDGIEDLSVGGEVDEKFLGPTRHPALFLAAPSSTGNPTNGHVGSNGMTSQGMDGVVDYSGASDGDEADYGELYPADVDVGRVSPAGGGMR